MKPVNRFTTALHRFTKSAGTRLLLLLLTIILFILAAGAPGVIGGPGG